MSDCLFCRIAAGTLPSAELYQDGQVFAFLDINPLRPGHAILVPKRHAAKLEDATPEDAAALMAAARRLAPLLCKAANAPDATIAINNGPGAGQEVPHLHIHIVPRRKDDGAGPIHAAFPGLVAMPSEDLHDLAIKVQRLVDATSKSGGK